MADIEIENVTPTGDWDFTGGDVKVPAPTVDTDASTKKYVDDSSDALVVDITGASGAITNHVADDTIHFSSGALWTSINSTTSVADDTSSAYVSHVADSSDPHSENLTQKNIIVSGMASFANAIVIGDHTTSGAAYVADAVFGTTSAAHVASSFAQGTMMLIYS